MERISRQEARWLVIFDNATDAASVGKLLPRNSASQPLPARDPFLFNTPLAESALEATRTQGLSLEEIRRDTNIPVLHFPV